MNGPVKLISLLRPDRTVQGWQEFATAQLKTEPAGLQRLLFNEVLPIDVRTGAEAAPTFVAIIEAWFSDHANADAFATSVRAHGGTVQLFVDALLIHDKGHRPLPNKIMVTMKGRADLSREQAQRHWRTRHVEIGLVDHNAGDFLQLYYQNHVCASDQPQGSATDYDGMPEFWVDPADLASVGSDSPVMRAIAEDEERFADRTSINTMLVIEHELFAAPGTESGWPVHESPLQDVLRAG